MSWFLHRGRVASRVARLPVATARAHRPWDEDIWKIFSQVVRSAPDDQMAQGMLLHASVKARMEQGEISAPDQPSVPYAPLNLTSYRNPQGNSILPIHFTVEI